MREIVKLEDRQGFIKKVQKAFVDATSQGINAAENEIKNMKFTIGEVEVPIDFNLEKETKKAFEKEYKKLAGSSIKIKKDAEKNLSKLYDITIKPNVNYKLDSSYKKGVTEDQEKSIQSRLKKVSKANKDIAEKAYREQYELYNKINSLANELVDVDILKTNDIDEYIDYAKKLNQYASLTEEARKKLKTEDWKQYKVSAIPKDVINGDINNVVAKTDTGKIKRDLSQAFKEVNSYVDNGIESVSDNANYKGIKFVDRFSDGIVSQVEDEQDKIVEHIKVLAKETAIKMLNAFDDTMDNNRALVKGEIVDINSIDKNMNEINSKIDKKAKDISTSLLERFEKLKVKIPIDANIVNSDITALRPFIKSFESVMGNADISNIVKSQLGDAFSEMEKYYNTFAQRVNETPSKSSGIKDVAQTESDINNLLEERNILENKRANSLEVISSVTREEKRNIEDVIQDSNELSSKLETVENKLDEVKNDLSSLSNENSFSDMLNSASDIVKTFSDKLDEIKNEVVAINKSFENTVVLLGTLSDKMNVFNDGINIKDGLNIGSQVEELKESLLKVEDVKSNIDKELSGTGSTINLETETNSFNYLRELLSDIHILLDGKNDLLAEEVGLSEKVDSVENKVFKELREVILDVVDLLKYKNQYLEESAIHSNSIKDEVDKFEALSDKLKGINEYLNTLKSLGDIKVKKGASESIDGLSKELIKLSTSLEVISKSDINDIKIDDIVNMVYKLSLLNDKLSGAKELLQITTILKKALAQLNTIKSDRYVNTINNLASLSTSLSEFVFTDNMKAGLEKAGEAYSNFANTLNNIPPVDISTLKQVVQAYNVIAKANNIKVGTQSKESSKDNVDDIVKENLSALKKLESQLNTQSNKTVDYANDIGKDLEKTPGYIDELINKVKDLQKAYDNLDYKDPNIKNQIKAIDDKFDKLIPKVKKFQDSIKDKTGILATEKEVANLQRLYDKIFASSKLSQKYSVEKEMFGKIISSANKTKKEVDDITLALRKLESEANKAGNTGATAFEKWSNRMVSLASYLTTFASFYDIINMLREGLSVVRELDTSLTEMRKVSNESLASLQAYQASTFDRAEKIGTTAYQLSNSTADWMRLGEDLKKASESADVSNILLNVSEFESIDDATQSLVSMSQAFKDIDKLDIVNKLNVIGNNFSISTDELASSLQRSAAALVTAGNDIDEAMALTVAGNAVTQDAQSVGAGLRTISLRIMGTEEAKEELASLGEDTEDYVVQTKSKLQGLVKDYTAVASNGFKGFDILKDNGEYKSTYEILLGISEIYKEILETDSKAGTNRGRALLEALAGKNRANIAASILQNPELLKQAYDSANKDYVDSAQKELDNYLDSVNGKITQIQSRAQEVAYNALDSESLKTILDNVLAITDGLAKVSKYLFSFPAILGTISGILSKMTGIGIFQGEGTGKDMFTNPFSQIMQGLRSPALSKDEMTKLKDLHLTMQQYGKDSIEVKKAMNGLDDKLVSIANTSEFASKGIEGINVKSKITTMGVNLLKMALEGLAVAAITIGIQLIAKGIDKLIVTSKEAKESFESFQNEIEDGENKVQELNSEIEELDKQIAEIQSKGKIELSDQAELERLQSERAELEAQLTLQEKLNKAKRQEATDETLKDYKPLTKKARKALRDLDIPEPMSLEEFNKANEASNNAFIDTYGDYETYYNGMMKNIEEFYDVNKKRIEENKRILEGQIPEIEAAIAQIESTNPNGKGLSDDDLKRYKEYKNILNEIYERVYDNKDYYEIVLKPVFEKDSLKNFEQQFKDTVNTKGLTIDDFLNEDGTADRKKMKEYFDDTVVDAFFDSLHENGVYVTDALKRLFDINNVEVEERNNNNLSFGQNSLTADLNTKEFEKEYEQRKEIIKEEMSKFADWSKDNPELQQFGEQIRNNTVRSMFGNVNMDDRVVIQWTDALKRKYSDALKEWGYEPETGGVDTVLGASSSFNIGDKEVEFAFTPVVNTDGEAELLGINTVEEYINRIISEATKDGDWSIEEILALDKEGIENADVYDSAGKKVGQTFIHGIIAGIDNSEGISARTVGELMHFSGKYGAIGMANQGFSDYTNNAIGNHLFGSNPYSNTSTGNETADYYSNQQYKLFEEKKKEITEYVEKNFKPEEIKVLLGMDIPKKVLRMTEKEIKAWLKGLDLKVEIKDAEFSGDKTFKNLDSVKTGLGSITDALGDYMQNGVKVDPNKIFSLSEMSGYEEFADVLAQYPDDIEKVRQAFNQLGTTFLDTSGMLDNLTQANQELYIQQLENMGVENAREFTMSRLINTDTEAQTELLNLANNYGLASAESVDMNNLTIESIKSLNEEAKAAGVDATALSLYLARKMMASTSSLSTSASINSLSALCEALGIAVAELKDYQDALAGKGTAGRNVKTESIQANYMAESGIYAEGRKATERKFNKKANITAKFKDLAKNSPGTSPSSPSSPSKSPKKTKTKKTKTKKSMSLTKTIYNWIERKLDVVAKKADRAQERIDRLLDWDKKRNATAKALEAVEEQLDANLQAAKRYYKYAKDASKEAAKEAVAQVKKEGSKAQKKKYGKNLSQATMDKYMNLVEEGKIGKDDIQAIKDPRIKAFVDTYIEWYEKMKAVEDEADSLTDDLKELYDTLAHNPIDRCAEQVEKLNDQLTILQGKANNSIYNLNSSAVNMAKQFSEINDILSDTIEETDILNSRISDEEPKESSINKIRKVIGLASKDDLSNQFFTKQILDTINKNRDDQVNNQRKTLEEYNQAAGETLNYYTKAVENLDEKTNKAIKLLTEKTAKQLGISNEEYNTLKDAISSGERISTDIINKMSDSDGKVFEDYLKAAINKSSAKDAYEEASTTALQYEQEYITNYRDLMLDAGQKAKAVADYYKTFFNLQERALSGQVELMEQYGLVLDRANYDEQYKIEENKLNLLKDEREVAKRYLTTIDEGSTQWYEQLEYVNSLNDEILETEGNMYALKDAANAIADTLYEMYETLNSRINNELQFLVDMMEGVEDFDPVSHTATDEGLARLYLYSAQMENLNTIIQKDKDSIKEYEKALKEANDNGLDRISANIMGADIDITTKQAQEKIDEFYDKVMEHTKDYKALRDSMIEWEINKLEEELNLAQEIVDARKDALTAEKNLHDYQRSIQDATQNINNLQKQITVLSGDNSQEGKARVQALQKQLKDAQKSLEETEYEKYISAEQEMLDNLMEEYTTLIDEEKTQRDELYERAKMDIILNADKIASTIDTEIDELGFSQYSTDVTEWLKSEKITTLSSELKTALAEQRTAIIGALTGSDNSLLGGLTAGFSSLSTSLADFSTYKTTVDNTFKSLNTTLTELNGKKFETVIKNEVQPNDVIVKIADQEITITNGETVKVNPKTGDPTGNSDKTSNDREIFENSSNTPDNSANKDNTTITSAPDIKPQTGTIEDVFAKEQAKDTAAENNKKQAVINFLKNLTSDQAQTIAQNGAIPASDMNKLVYNYTSSVGNKGLILKKAGYTELYDILGVKNADEAYQALLKLGFSSANTGYFEDYKQNLVQRFMQKYGDNPSKAIKDYMPVNKLLYAATGKILGTDELKELCLLLTGRKYENSNFGGLFFNALWEKIKKIYSKFKDTSVSYDEKTKKLKFTSITGFTGGFAKGGIVDYVHGQGEDGIAMVRQGEGILTPAQTKTFMYELAPRMDDIIDASKLIKDTTANLDKVVPMGETNVEATFQFDLENVTNAGDIIKQIQTNNNVQKAIQSVTIDRIAGGSRLGVNKF